MRERVLSVWVCGGIAGDGGVFRVKGGARTGMWDVESGAVWMDGVRKCCCVGWWKAGRIKVWEDVGRKGEGADEGDGARNVGWIRGKVLAYRAVMAKWRGNGAECMGIGGKRRDFRGDWRC